MTQEGEKHVAASRRLTNVEVVTSIMEFSDFGALAQVFVMDALHKQARATADAPPESFEGEAWAHSFMTPEAWQGVAREIAGKLDAHFGK